MSEQFSRFVLYNGILNESMDLVVHHQSAEGLSVSDIDKDINPQPESTCAENVSSEETNYSQPVQVIDKADLHQLKLSESEEDIINGNSPELPKTDSPHHNDVSDDVFTFQNTMGKLDGIKNLLGKDDTGSLETNAITVTLSDDVDLNNKDDIWQINKDIYQKPRKFLSVHDHTSMFKGTSPGDSLHRYQNNNSNKHSDLMSPIGSTDLSSLHDYDIEPLSPASTSKCLDFSKPLAISSPADSTDLSSLRDSDTTYTGVDSSSTDFLSESSTSDDGYIQYGCLDSSLADLQGAAFRYASLHIGSDKSLDKASLPEDKCFPVYSLGWLPMLNCSSDPKTCSAEVNQCIRHLSSSHGPIFDSVGAWGDGKRLNLVIDGESLKLIDGLTNVVLQSQLIKQIKLWGVGHDSAYDFAYVARDTTTRMVKCHVFRCENHAKTIAKALHDVCVKILESNKLNHEEAKEKLAMSTTLPIPKKLDNITFPVRYLGCKHVESVNGINTIKNVIRNITTDDIALCKEALASIDAAALVLISSDTQQVIVNCRMRFLSFMGIGDDISLFAFINVPVTARAVCHVVQCQPNAIKLALAVQEACMLRFQKAIDCSHTETEKPLPTVAPRWSWKSIVKRVFSGKGKV